jgi:hypothetical protein
MDFRNVAERTTDYLNAAVSRTGFIAYLIHSFSQLTMSMTQSDSRPIQHEEIAARSRELWQKAGSPEGRDLEFWLGAEAELQRDREDVKQTKNGQIHDPARSTPSGDEKTGEAVKKSGKTFPKDQSAVKPASRTRRVSAPVK